MKKILRKQVLDARDRLTADERAAKSREIGKQLFALPEFSAARVIMLFASFRSEVDTVPMIRQALLSGKRVILPKVTGKVLELFEIADYDLDVVSGVWGIPEPRTGRPGRVEDVDLMVVPGVAFDERGNRIGYGAGYYDKLLPSFRGSTVALAFEAQIVTNVPVDPHDVPVGKIVTEKRVIEAK